METRLTDIDIVDISRMLASDEAAHMKTDQICRDLGLTTPEIEGLKLKLEDQKNPYDLSDFFRDALKKYKTLNGAGATVRSLQNVFQGLGFTKINESMEFKQKLMKILRLEHGRLAFRILKILSFFEENAIIHAEFFVHPEIGSTVEEAYAAVSILKALIPLRGDQPGHIYLDGNQKAVQARMTSNEMKESLVFAFEILNKYFHPKGECADSELVDYLIPHALSIWKWALPYVDLIQKYASLPGHICSLLNCDDRSLEEMSLMAGDFATDIRNILGANHVEMIELILLEGIAYCKLKDYRLSTSKLKSILPMSKFIFGEAHETTLRISNIIAQNAGAQEQREQQFAMLKSIETICEDTHGSEAPITLLTRFHRAYALYEIGKLEEALDLCEYLRGKRKEMTWFQGESWVLSVCSLIGTILFHKGDFSDGYEMSLSIHEQMKEEYGETNSMTLYNIENMERCKAAIALVSQQLKLLLPPAQNLPLNLKK